MASGIADLVALLDLEQIELNVFRGRSLDEPRQRVFGGQVAAQALVAAGRTVDRGRVHSLHSYFLLPGDPTIPILYEVDRIRDGRSFTTRRVRAIQRGKPIFNMACSFHEDEDGLVHQIPMPDAPRPEGLASLTDEMAAHPSTALGSFLRSEGLDIRYVSEPPWERAGTPDSHQQIWVRATDRLADDWLLHAAFITLISDLTLVDTIVRWHARSPWDDEFLGASLDHCMWFHRPSRIDEWLFYDQTSPASFGARGLALGAMYDTAGTLVVSVAQEGLIRVKQERP